MRFLVFSTDLPPIPGYPTSGTALRTWNLAEGLIDNGHEVIYSSPKDAVETFIEKHKSDNLDSKILGKINELKRLSFDAQNQSQLINQFSPDVILCGHWPAWTIGRKPAQPLIIDLAGPHLLERYYQGDKNLEAATTGKLSAISCADYFIVSGQKQKLYFLSYMLRAKITQPENRITIIPMPLPENTYLSKEKNYDCKNPSFIFGGVFLPWQDPSWGINSLVEEIEAKKSGSLTLVGGPHPHYPINSAIYNDLFKKLKNNPQTNVFPLLAYDKFQEEMYKSDIALDLMAWNLERELAITIRSSTYLWSGLPIIYNDYSDLSELIKSYNAGWCVSPGDKKSFADIIEEVYSSNEVYKQKRNGAINLSKEQFDRKKLTEKILSLLKTPRISLNTESDITIEHGDGCHFLVNNSSELEQKFTSRINGFSEIKILIATFGQNQGSDITFSLQEEGKQDFLFNKTIKRSEIADNQWLSFKFNPIFDSAGKDYTFVISSNEANQETSLSPWSISFSPYPLNGLFINGKKSGSNALCIKTFSLRN